MYWVRFSAPLCKVRTTATKCGSRLPCARGGGKTKGFDGGVVSATSESVYSHFLSRNISLRFRQRGDTYPFSFVTKRKAVRR